MNIPSFVNLNLSQSHTSYIYIYIYTYRGEGTNWAQKSVKFLVWSNRTWRHFTQRFTYPGGTWWSFVSFNRWPSTKDRPCFRNQIAPAGPIPFACTWSWKVYHGRRRLRAALWILAAWNFKRRLAGYKGITKIWMEWWMVLSFPLLDDHSF